MVVCRVVLGDPVRLENLARLFLYVMATQIIRVTVVALARLGPSRDAEEVA